MAKTKKGHTPGPFLTTGMLHAHGVNCFGKGVVYVVQPSAYQGASYMVRSYNESGDSATVLIGSLRECLERVEKAKRAAIAKAEGTL